MRTSTVATAVGVTAAASIVGYALYFDYKRRNDVEFRKELRKQKKRVDKSVKMSASSSSASSDGGASAVDMEAALDEIRKEDVPADPKAREGYFMEHVTMAEALANRGPLFAFPAALSFYRALRVYPAPIELLTIYQNTLPPEVFKIVVELANANVKTQAESYYKRWPPAEMNVQVRELPVVKNGKPVDESAKSDSEAKTRRRALVALKDFAAGDTIYEENPIVTVLDLDIEGEGTHCSHCLREVEGLSPITVEDPLGTTFCSMECQDTATRQHHDILFGRGPVLPPVEGQAPPVPSSEEMIKRAQAQAAFIVHLRQSGKFSPLLAARYAARTITAELSGQLPVATSNVSSDLPEADSTDDSNPFAFNDHVDRLRYMELQETPDETTEALLLKDILNGAMPGLDRFINDTWYQTLKGKMLYNAIGVVFGQGRLNKPTGSDRFPAWDFTRTPLGTDKQIGSALYRVSSYLAHSCSPTVRPTFPLGTARLRLVANQDIKAGDELTMAYVRTLPTQGETAAENRRTRRQQLARGWRFACECERCAAEATEMKNDATAKSVPSNGVIAIENLSAQSVSDSITRSRRPDE